jgi:hypothetical protein
MVLSAKSLLYRSVVLVPAWLCASTVMRHIRYAEYVLGATSENSASVRNYA